MRIRYNQGEQINEILSDFIAHVETYLISFNPFLSNEEYYEGDEDASTAIDVYKRQVYWYGILDVLQQKMDLPRRKTSFKTRKNGTGQDLSLIHIFPSDF